VHKPLILNTYTCMQPDQSKVQCE